MFKLIDDLLLADEIAELRRIAGSANFIDGRSSNPHSPVKDNVHLHDQDAYMRSATIMMTALRRSEDLTNYAFPVRTAPPLLTRYSKQMKYGLHADAAFMQVGDIMLRSDLSCTIFLSDPETYVGGALRIRLGDVDHRVRGKAGSAVVYPSTTLHEVEPVESGERLVGLTFMQSRIRDTAMRDLLYELNEVAALEGLKMDFANYSRLQRVQFNLLRLWSEAG